MRKLLKVELKKAFFSRWFIIALLIGIVLVSVSAYQTAVVYYGENGMADYIRYCISNKVIPKDGLEGMTLYNRWLGATMDTSSVVFFYLVPLLAILPCGWNASEEINGGYLKVVVPQIGRKKFYFAKLLAAFISGGAVVAIPLLCSLCVTATIVPAIIPHPYNNMYYWVYHGDLLSSLAFSHPLVYALVYIVLDFIFAGFFACLPLIVALRSEKRIAALVVPYIAVILCDAARNFLNYICFIEISPLNLMHSLPPQNAAKPFVLIAWLLIFSVAILVFGLRKGVNQEIV